MGKVFVIDPAKCNGCRNCQIACKDEHCDNDWSPVALPQPDTGHFWIGVNETVHGSVPKVKVSYVVELCQHCGDAPCMKAAPDAVYRRDDGLVIVDPEKAKGKRELVEACPYGAIFWNEEYDVPQKCTGCAHLLDEGWTVPRCVDACPHDAIRFGDESEFADELGSAEFIAPERADADRPRVYYLNLPKRFVAGVVVDLESDEVVVGAQITLENAETSELLQTETDEFGDFWFHQVDAALYNVYVEAEGYMTRMVKADATSKDCNAGPIDVFAAAE